MGEEITVVGAIIVVGLNCEAGEKGAGGRLRWDARLSRGGYQYYPFPPCLGVLLGLTYRSGHGQRSGGEDGGSDELHCENGPEGSRRRRDEADASDGEEEETDVLRDNKTIYNQRIEAMPRRRRRALYRGTVGRSVGASVRALHAFQANTACRCI